MTDYVRIPIRADEHRRLVALQSEWMGQIDSYLSRPSLSDVIKELLDQQETKAMTSKYDRIDSTITYSVSTDSDSYTRESDHEPYIPLLIQRIELEATDWMAENYSSIKFSTRRDGRTTHDEGTDGEQFVRNAIEGLDDYINANWTDWFEEIIEANPNM